MNFSERDFFCMQQALLAAQLAESENEVPIGAVLVLDEHPDEIILAHNQSIQLSDPTAHAEIQVLRRAGQFQNNYRLPQSTLYVTLEPCLMCLGAMLHARISRLVYASSDPKIGACAHLNLFSSQVNHQIQIQSGLCAQESSFLLTEFFKKRR